MNTKTDAHAAPPKLYGLVLAGGSSSRMGHDKGVLEYNGMPQREYVYQLLNKVCEKVFLGIQKHQLDTIPKGLATIVDLDEVEGPFNGIMSAHEAYPAVAWLVLACDLPLIDLKAVEQLVKERDPKTFATAFMAKCTTEPEPLACIWEPAGLRRAKKYLSASEGRSPKRFLSEVDVKAVVPWNGGVLYNANAVEDYEWAKNQLKGQEGS
jgi:molybdenum cofactor guanylyltransferase